MIWHLLWCLLRDQLSIHSMPPIKQEDSYAGTVVDNELVKMHSRESPFHSNLLPAMQCSADNYRGKLLFGGGK